MQGASLPAQPSESPSRPGGQTLYPFSPGRLDEPSPVTLGLSAFQFAIIAS